MNETTKTAPPDAAVEPQYWAVIPSPVRYDEALTPSDKLLYGEISSLTNKFGYCFASNAYFAALYGLTERTIRRMLADLQENGYIRIEDGNGGRGRRRIYSGINPLSTAAPNPDKNVREPGQKCPGNPDKNVRENNKENNKANKPPKPPKGRRGAERKSAPIWKPERFEAFWRYYPAIPDGNGRGRRPAKDRAARAWDKLRPDDDTIKAMGVALMRQKESRQWRDGVGIPYASTWLNGRVWEEESEALPSAGAMPDEYGEGRKDLVLL